MAEVPTSKKPAITAPKPIVAKPALSAAAKPAISAPVAAKPTPPAAASTIKAAAIEPRPAPKASVSKPPVAKAVAAKAPAPLGKTVAQPAAAPSTPPKAVVAPVVAPAAPVVAAPVAPRLSVAAPAPRARTEDATPAAALAAIDQPKEIATAIPAAAPAEGKSVMNDTIAKVQETLTNATKESTDRASALFNDVNGRTKAAMEKGTKAIEELVEFSKGNLEAVVASGRVAAKGAEEIAKYSADYGRQSIEKANATAKQFAAVKTPAEFLQLQGDVAKQALDSVVSEGAKFTESYLKLLGEIAQPISNRYAVAAEKVKSVVAA